MLSNIKHCKWSKWLFHV